MAKMALQIRLATSKVCFIKVDSTGAIENMV